MDGLADGPMVPAAIREQVGAEMPLVVSAAVDDAVRDSPEGAVRNSLPSDVLLAIFLLHTIGAVAIGPLSHRTRPAPAPAYAPAWSCWSSIEPGPLQQAHLQRCPVGLADGIVSGFVNGRLESSGNRPIERPWGIWSPSSLRAWEFGFSLVRAGVGQRQGASQVLGWPHFTRRG